MFVSPSAPFPFHHVRTRGTRLSPDTASAGAATWDSRPPERAEDVRKAPGPWDFVAAARMRGDRNPPRALPLPPQNPGAGGLILEPTGEKNQKKNSNPNFHVQVE